MLTPDEIKEAKGAYDGVAPMILRDLAAVAAMKALIESPLASREIARDFEVGAGHHTSSFAREIAMNAYDMADAMLWAREVSAADNRAAKDGGAA